MDVQDAPSTEPNPLLEAALDYAAHGIYVFPTRLRVRGQNKKDVQPIAAWKEASTIDPETIRAWWGREGAWAGESVCIDTGKSRLVGIDQDISDGKRGPDEWERIGQRSELRVITGSGGYHDYFRADPARPVTVDNTGAVADGVDVRGDGGFLFAPPSVDPRGGSWKWESEPDWDALPDVPVIVIERVTEAQSTRRPKPVNTDPEVKDFTGTSPFMNASAATSFGPDGGYKTRKAAGELLVSELTAFRLLISEGSKRSHILAGRLGVLIGHGIDVFWSYDQAMDTILAACRENGFIGAHTEKYAREQTHNGLIFGMKQPWIESKAPLSAETLEVAPTAGRLRRAMYNRSELRQLPRPMPMIEGTIYRESIVVLSGKFGTYKSFIAVGWTCCLVTGTPWFGHAVGAPVPVIYAAAEGAYGINGRIDAWEKETGVIVPDSLHLISVSARLNNPADMEELGLLIQETGAQVVVFDTLHASTPGLDENDSGDMGTAVDVLRSLRDQYKITSVLVHHTGHSGERARGSSSLEDDADTSFVIKLGGNGEDRGPEILRTLIHRKAKDSRLTENVELILEMIDLEDGESGIVRERGAMEALAGTGDAPPDTGQELAVSDVQGWARVAQSHPKADVQRQILQALHDVAGVMGRTEEKILRAVAGRWYGGQTGRGPGKLDTTAFGKSWTKVLQLEGPEGRIVVQGESGGKNYIINPDWLEHVKMSESYDADLEA